MCARLVMKKRKYDSIRNEIKSLKWSRATDLYKFSILCHSYKLITYKNKKA